MVGEDGGDFPVQETRKPNKAFAAERKKRAPAEKRRWPFENDKSRGIRDVQCS